MQRLISLVKTVGTALARNGCITPNTVNSVQNASGTSLLSPYVPVMNMVCGMKIKGRVKRRCQSCYFVVRDERLYVMCPKFPRHKQMVMKPKPHNTWILTHATQSKVRPW